MLWVLKRTLALEHTLTKQIGSAIAKYTRLRACSHPKDSGAIAEYASLIVEHFLAKQRSGYIAEYASLRTRSHQTK